MDRIERIKFLKSVGVRPFIVVGKWNQIRKCDMCKSTYFQKLRLVGDDRRGEAVVAEYYCWYCGQFHEDGWFWKKFVIHYGWLKRGAR